MPSPDVRRPTGHEDRSLLITRLRLSSEFSYVPARIEGRIIEVSDSGNLITDIAAKQLDDVPRDERVTIRCDEHETTCIFDSSHDQPAATLIAILGTSGNLELEIVGDSARLMLGVGVGEKVEVVW